MISPSACPVVTGSWRLESRSKRSRSSKGSPSSPISNSSRRLAASATASPARPAASPSAGRVRVSTQLGHSSPGAPASQLQAAISALAQRAPSAGATISRSGQRNASAVPQFRQAELSKNTSRSQVGQENARMAARG